MDWPAVLEEARAQSVVIPAFSQCEAYAMDEAERREIQRQVQSLAARSIRSFEQHTAVHRLMADQGIPYCILKGVASAWYYPDRLARQMGDVDFFVARSDFARAAGILEANGFTAEGVGHVHHVGYHKPGVELELHFDAPGVPDGEAGDRVRKLLALWMAEIAVGSGVSQMVATPHANQRGRFENEAEAVRRAVWRLQEELEKRSIPLRVHAGMEIMASPETERLIREQRVLSLAGSRYYLLEFPFGEDPQYMQRIIHGVLRQGKAPVLAHPERYRYLREQPAMLRRWMREGCLVQINAGSLRGHFGQGAAQAARQFLNLNLVSVIASDTHDPIRRTPDLAWIRDFMELHYGAVYARAVLELHPRAIVEDAPVPCYA